MSLIPTAGHVPPLARPLAQNMGEPGGGKWYGITRASVAPVPRRPDDTFGMSVRRYATHRKDNNIPGGNPSAVQKALKSGRITRNEHGKIDPMEADKSWAEKTNPASAPKTQQQAQDAGVSQTYRAARANTELWRSRRERLLYEKLKGKLIDKDEAYMHMYKVGRTLRDRVLAIVTKLDKKLAREKDERKIRTILTEAIRKAVDGLDDAYRDG